MVVRVAPVAAMILGCLCDNAPTRSSIKPSGFSISTNSNITSIAFAFAAGRVAANPFSIIGTLVVLRVLWAWYKLTMVLLVPSALSVYTHLEHACTPANFRNEQYAARPSTCAATFESATAPFQRPGSCKKGRNTGSDSSGDFWNCLLASS